MVEAPLETGNMKGDESACVVQRQRQVKGANQDLAILGLQEDEGGDYVELALLTMKLAVLFHTHMQCDAVAVQK